MSADRSSLAVVRNPVLGLPAARRIADLPPEAREIIADIMRDLSIDARSRAQESWRKNKGPMAVYWKAVGAYSTHIKNALRQEPTR